MIAPTRRPRAPRRSPRVKGPRAAAALVLVASMLAMLAVLAPVASAHAVLESSDPVDGSVLATAPSKVTLQYSESVRVTLASVRVLDARGARVDEGDTRNGADDSTVVVDLKGGLAKGSYVVAWSVVSADGHPVHGGLVFSVGAPSTVGKGVLQGALRAPGTGIWSDIGYAVRALHFLGSLLAVGGAAFLVLVDVSAGSRRLARWVVGGAVVAAAGALAEVPVLAAQATGLGLTSVTRTGVASQILGDGQGWSTVALVAAVVLASAAALARGTNLRTALVAAALVLFAGSVILTGHARSAEPRALAVVADALHVTAAAIWTGGLALLVLSLRRRRRADARPDAEAPSPPAGGAVAAAAVVRRFSSLATVSIVAVLAAGGALAWIQVRSLHAFDTSYGRLLLAKLAVVALVVGAGAYNHWRLVPLVGRVRDDHGESPAWRRLRSVMQAEVAGIVAVVVLSVILASTAPARTAIGAGAGPASATGPFGSGTVNLTVDPARPGTSVMHIYLLDAEGRPDDSAKAITVELRLPSRDLGPLTPAATKAGPGHYQVSAASFPLAGTWQVTIDARIDEFTARRATLDVKVRS